MNCPIKLPWRTERLSTVPNLLVFSRDPGPTNQLVAALEVLGSPPAAEEPEGLSALRGATQAALAGVRVVARAPGATIWRAAGWNPTIWEDNPERAAAELLLQHDAGVLLTGTSDIDESGDRALWEGARRIGIKSHALLDHPANLADRFCDGDGQRIYPDWLYVPDTTFASRLAAAGAPADRIRIIGDLHHARVARLASRRSREEVASLRAGWGAGPDDYVVLFASECTREMAARGRPAPYDEFAVLTRLLNMLAAGERPGGGGVDPAVAFVLVRPHPRDARGKYEEIVARHCGPPRVVVSTDGAPDAALLAADLVTGMNSSLLYEALTIGRSAISLTDLDLFAGKSAAG
jgi:hypothetical protein